MSRAPQAGPQARPQLCSPHRREKQLPSSPAPGMPLVHRAKHARLLAPCLCLQAAATRSPQHAPAAATSLISRGKSHRQPRYPRAPRPAAPSSRVAARAPPPARPPAPPAPQGRPVPAPSPRTRAPLSRVRRVAHATLAKRNTRNARADASSPPHPTLSAPSPAPTPNPIASGLPAAPATPKTATSSPALSSL